MGKRKVVYVVDDHFEISEEVKNMSEEELDYRIAILEAEAIDAGKDIPYPILQVIWQVKR